MNKEVEVPDGLLDAMRVDVCYRHDMASAIERAVEGIGLKEWRGDLLRAKTADSLEDAWASLERFDVAHFLMFTCCADQRLSLLATGKCVRRAVKYDLKGTGRSVEMLCTALDFAESVVAGAEAPKMPIPKLISWVGSVVDWAAVCGNPIHSPAALVGRYVLLTQSYFRSLHPELDPNPPTAMQIRETADNLMGCCWKRVQLVMMKDLGMEVDPNARTRVPPYVVKQSHVEMLETLRQEISTDCFGIPSPGGVA